MQALENTSRSETQLDEYLLRIAFYILYGKPFKQRAFVRIDEEIVPADMMGTHKCIITLRDKMFAHSDSALSSRGGDPINTVLVEVKATGIAFGMNTLRPLKGSLEIFLSLIERLLKTTLCRRDKIWKRYHKKLVLPLDSRWIVNLGEEDREELLRVTTKEIKTFSHSVDVDEVSP